MNTVMVSIAKLHIVTGEVIVEISVHEGAARMRTYVFMAVDLLV